MSEGLRQSLRDLIWPAIRLLIWIVTVLALAAALATGRDPLVVLGLLGGAVSVAEPIARWVQSAVAVRLPITVADPGAEAAS
jgi:hypothetical protein